MNPAGFVLIIAGIWVVSQVFAGNALQRMNIITPEEAATANPIDPLTPYLPGGPQNPVLPQPPNWSNVI